MSHDSRGHCFFARQPAKPEETTEAIEGSWASCCGALRYGGTDSEILVRMAEVSLAEQCDFRLKDEPKLRARNCVSFEFEGDTKTAEFGKEITTYIADSLGESGDGEFKVKSLRVSASGGSAVYEWGHVLSEPCCAMFTIEFQSNTRRWAIQISREDGHQQLRLQSASTRRSSRISGFVLFNGSPTTSEKTAPKLAICSRCNFGGTLHPLRESKFRSTVVGDYPH
jgi:hypothetical protein